MNNCYSKECGGVLNSLLTKFNLNIFSVLLTVSPMILSDDRALTQLLGSNLVFSCNASGLPAPTITWLKFGTQQVILTCF